MTDTDRALEGLGLTAHHRDALDRLVALLEPDPDILALVLAGSLAHGYARPDSDIDVQLLITPEAMATREREGRLTWVEHTICDWDGGYVDGKFSDVELLEDVATRGSEPARYAWRDARILFRRLDGLDELLERIVRYPVEGRDERVVRFTAQLLAWRWFHSEAVKKDSPYLGALARHKVTLFACRIVLARNERLYPFHKWMLAETERATDRPPGLLGDIDRMLREPDQARVEGLVAGLLDWYGIDEAAANATWGSRFMEDTELAWRHGRTPIDDL
ncbi:MAG: nucleotidyltransferase domain-containing protein [Candidatus Limnocylindrales bacterium]